MTPEARRKYFNLCDPDAPVDPDDPRASDIDLFNGKDESPVRGVVWVDELVQDTAARVEDARAQLERAVMRPLLAPLEELSRLGRALRRGLEVNRQLGGLSAQGRGKGRGYGSDDHLFI